MIPEQSSPNPRPEPFSISEALKKSIAGPAVLVLRQGIVQAIGLAGGIVIARTASQEHYGFFGICTFLFYLIVAFGDLGFGAAIIRNASAPETSDFRRLLTLRQFVDLVVCGAVWLAAPVVAVRWSSEPDAVSAVRMTAIAAAVFSFQIVPTVALERQLRFARLAAVEVIQAAAFMTTVLLCLASGRGLLSFGFGWLVHALTGAVLATWALPWRIGWSNPKPMVSEHWRFALPYQANGLLNLARDGLSPLFLGVLLGSAEVGRLNWALMLATFAASGLLVLQRMYFPLFAAATRDGIDGAARLNTTLRSVLEGVHGIIAPLAVLSLVYSTEITRLVFGEKWLNALPLYYVLWFLNFVIPTASVLAALLNALGRSRTVFRYSLLLTSITWALGAPLVYFFGSIGCAAAFVLSYATIALLSAEVRREVECDIAGSLRRPWVLAAAAGAGSYITSRFFAVDSLAMLFVQGSAWATVYSGLAYIFLFKGKLFDAGPGAGVSTPDLQGAGQMKKIPDQGDAAHDETLQGQRVRSVK